MKGFGFLLVLLLLFFWAAGYLYLGHSNNGRTTPFNPAASMVSTGSMNIMWQRRKLKGSMGKDEDDSGGVNLEDYGAIDPVPSSTASVRPGPIQHGTPLMPYIPKPASPPVEHANMLH